MSERIHSIKFPHNILEHKNYPHALLLLQITNNSGNFRSEL